MRYIIYPALIILLTGLGAVNTDNHTNDAHTSHPTGLSAGYWQQEKINRPVAVVTESVPTYTSVFDVNFTGADESTSAGNVTLSGERKAAGLHFLFGRGNLYRIPLYLTPFVIVLGVIGNIIAFIVLFRFVREKSCSSDLYLCALALFDIGGLLFSTMLFWLSSFVRLELFFNNENRLLDIFLGTYGACQTWFYLSFFFRYCSHWTVVIFTIERYCILSRPFESSSYTLKRAMWKILALIIVSLLINVVSFWMFGKRVTPGGNFCVWGEVFFISSYVHLSLLCLLPSVLIIVFNINIVYTLVKHRKGDPGFTTNDHKDREAQVTWRLLAVSITFVALTFPFMVVAFYRNTLRLQGVKHFSELTSEFYSVAAFLYMCNYAVNIVCYCGTGARFRLAVKDLLCCRTYRCCLSKPRSNSSSSV